MSSPMINNVVLLGCSFCYVFVFLLGIDSRFVNDRILGILCNVSLFIYVRSYIIYKKFIFISRYNVSGDRA